MASPMSSRLSSKKGVPSRPAMLPPPPDDPVDVMLSSEDIIPPPPRSLFTNEELEARTNSTMRPLAKKTSKPRKRNAAIS